MSATAPIVLTPEDAYAGAVVAFNRRDFYHANLLSRAYLRWASESGARVDPARLAKATAIERETRRYLETQHADTREDEMPKVSEMNPSKYLKAVDCEEADLVLTIRDVKQETVGQGADAQQKWILYFEETDKGLVLNKVNTNTIAKIHGDDTDDWEGKRVALYATEVEYAGETMLGIRVRLREPKKAKKGAATAAADTGSQNDPADESDVPF